MLSSLILIRILLFAFLPLISTHLSDHFFFFLIHTSTIAGYVFKNFTVAYSACGKSIFTAEVANPTGTELNNSFLFISFFSFFFSFIKQSCLSLLINESTGYYASADLHLQYGPLSNTYPKSKIETYQEFHINII